MRQALNEAAIKSAPPAAIVVWNSIATIPAEKWLTYLTIAYVVLQVWVLFRDKVLRDRRAARKGDRK